MTTKIYYRSGNSGLIYERDNYMHGGGWHSFERGVKEGEVRVINGVISQAWSIEFRGFFKKPDVHWISVDPRALKKVDISDKP